MSVIRLGRVTLKMYSVILRTAFQRVPPPKVMCIPGTYLFCQYKKYLCLYSNLDTKQPTARQNCLCNLVAFMAVQVRAT